MSMPISSVFMLGLLVVPFGAALAIAFLGPKRPAEARWIALAASVVGLVLASFLTISFLETRINRPLDPAAAKTFVPEFVPGSSAESLHATTWNMMTFGDVNHPRGTVQFFIGLDG